jgi:hypothetical protein
MKLRFPVALWQHKQQKPWKMTWYAFPLAGHDAGDLGIFPLVNNKEWDPCCTVPAGTPVSDVTAGEGNLVQCKLPDVEVTTANWALTD